MIAATRRSRRARSAGSVRDQPAKARWAAAMARSASSRPALATRPTTWRGSAGLVGSSHRPVVTSRPPILSGHCRADSDSTSRSAPSKARRVASTPKSLSGSLANGGTIDLRVHLARHAVCWRPSRRRLLMAERREEVVRTTPASEGIVEQPVVERVVEPPVVEEIVEPTVATVAAAPPRRIVRRWWRREPAVVPTTGVVSTEYYSAPAYDYDPALA